MLETFRLSGSTQASVNDAFADDLKCILAVSEALPDQTGEFSDSDSSAGGDFSYLSGTDLDLRESICRAHLDACVTVSGDAALEQTVYLCTEDPILHAFLFLVESLCLYLGS